MAIIKLLLILFMTFFGSLGGFFFKKASDHPFGINKPFILKLGTGGAFYLAGAILNIYLLTLLPYTVVYPITSVTYIWTMILSSMFLNETITVKKGIGILLISGGSVLLVV
ncbi:MULTISPECIES: EamA family transporter [Pontibacillus]|uniref:EamA family transporter n=1 Tax=Pontibacillus chungwhensis TaxID=265426 RepID=A0ABY8V1E9_9BACI|nr:EamA family transporter [Pontibacillus chungwhensis]MCD5324256.1 EamA family transporter [Pontibacillus sp. HN14]WIF97691.1 EamA family transporter [Pontibacillus chungwhensis]